MMNEQIKQLAVQAGYLPDNFGIGHWDMPECKRFAELIIRECADIGTINQFQPNSVGNYIKEHFGVE
jgi:hypothetical protein